MTVEREPIVIVFSNSPTKLTLSAEVTEMVWAAVDRGWANSPQEYIERLMTTAIERTKDKPVE